jgi:putative ATPase
MFYNLQESNKFVSITQLFDIVKPLCLAVYNIYMPLADTLRPNTLADFIGQGHIVGSNGPIKLMIEKQNLASMIFWGPPASGKTTLAHIIAVELDCDFYSLSAVMDGKEELKNILAKAQDSSNLLKKITSILFIDEIHRWNKAQQDALLPFVEKGIITLIGATTENPSFSVNTALLSRCRVFVFQPHIISDIVLGLKKATKTLNIKVKPDLLDYIATLSDGDLRFALTTLEICHNLGSITKLTIEQAAQKSLMYDTNGEEHYNLISAVHKSMRASDATASVYWTMRMLQAGKDPLYLARRMLRFASEDIGNTNPNALLLANQVYDAVKNLGMPECETALAQLAQYLANSPKDNSAYTASKQAKSDIQKYGTLPVPLHLRNAPTKLMKDLNYGSGYIYDHDLESKKSGQQCMPDKLIKQDYFK